MPNTIASTKIGDDAASAVEQRVLGWCRSHEGAPVAEKREAAKLIMEGFMQAYDDKAAKFAPQGYRVIGRKVCPFLISNPSSEPE